MTQVMAVFDQQDERSAICHQRFLEKERLFDHQVASRFSGQDAALSLLSYEGAPFFAWQRDGDYCWLLGRPDISCTPGADIAQILYDRYTTAGAAGVANLTGYFVCIIKARHEVVIFTDLLGLFPLYYHQSPDHLIVGSSSNIPTYHPQVDKEINHKALIGHLLVMHECGGESLWRGINRLNSGEVLIYSEKRLKVVKADAIPVGDDLCNLPLDAQVDLMSEAMIRACQEYADAPVSLLLSGGLDSRIMAGFLSRSDMRCLSAYTLGVKNDNDYRCAQRLTNQPGMAPRVT